MNRLRRVSYAMVLPTSCTSCRSGVAAALADAAEQHDRGDGAGDGEEPGAVLLGGLDGLLAGLGVLDGGHRVGGGVLDGARGGLDGGAGGHDDLLGGAVVLGGGHATLRGVVVEAFDDVGGH